MATAALAHMRQDRTRQHVRRAEVDRGDAIPLLDGHLVDADRLVDAGVVDQDVDTAQSRDERVDRLVDRGSVGDVESQRLGRVAVGAELVARLAREVEQHVSGDDMHSGGGKLAADLGAEAARATGHERDAPVELA